MKIKKVRPLSKADIKRALKLAGAMDAYEAKKKTVPYTLLVRFCDTLNITPDAEPFDPEIRWPKPIRAGVQSRGRSRLSEFSAAYLPGIEATRFEDHSPKWLKMISERVMDRWLDEKENPCLRYSITCRGRLLDSYPMQSDQPPVAFDIHIWSMEGFRWHSGSVAQCDRHY